MRAKIKRHFQHAHKRSTWGVTEIVEFSLPSLRLFHYRDCGIFVTAFEDFCNPYSFMREDGVYVANIANLGQ
jgi:hypothetical protein